MNEPQETPTPEEPWLHNVLAHIHDACPACKQPTDLAARLLSVEAQVAEMRVALENWQYVWKETQAEYDDCMGASDLADKALSSTPSALLEELKEAYEEAANTALQINNQNTGHPPTTAFMRLAKAHNDRVLALLQPYCGKI